MPAYSFNARFAEPILAGTKGGTIRAPGRPANRGRDGPSHMPPHLSRQPVAELRSIVRRAIRDGNLPEDRVYQMAQFAPARRRAPDYPANPLFKNIDPTYREG